MAFTTTEEVVTRPTGSPSTLKGQGASSASTLIAVHIMVREGLTIDRPMRIFALGFPVLARLKPTWLCGGRSRDCPELQGILKMVGVLEMANAGRWKWKLPTRIARGGVVAVAYWPARGIGRALALELTRQEPTAL